MAARVVCVACGDENPRDSMCFMSDDGEGPHDLVERVVITASDREFLERLEVHYEQGAAER